MVMNPQAHGHVSMFLTPSRSRSVIAGRHEFALVGLPVLDLSSDTATMLASRATLTRNSFDQRSPADCHRAIQYILSVAHLAARLLWHLLLQLPTGTDQVFQQMLEARPRVVQISLSVKYQALCQKSQVCNDRNRYFESRG